MGIIKHIDLYGAGNDLGVEVVGQHSVEARLDREGFVEELLVKVLLDVVDENDGDSVVVVLRSTRATHHLKWNHSPVTWSFDNNGRLSQPGTKDNGNYTA